jgi:bacterioferritin (cytochrome b1)
LPVNRAWDPFQYRAPGPINVGKTLKEMVAQDVNDEEKAVDMHKELIALARKGSDVTTAFKLMEILKEKDHYDTYRTLLE